MAEMSIIAIALTTNDNRVRYTDAVAGVRVIKIEAPKGVDIKTELARADGPIDDSGPERFDMEAADALLAATGYQRIDDWRGWGLDGWATTIEAEHAPGYDEYMAARAQD